MISEPIFTVTWYRLGQQKIVGIEDYATEKFHTFAEVPTPGCRCTGKHNALG
jgi:hypothetical protein